MTTTIGVYDSGIGGLTTLSVLMRRFPACGFCYYADNARMPFGTKSADEVKRAVNTALSKMSGECSRLVLGCNTASVTANPDGVFKLRPRLENFSPATTLVLATPLTLAGLRATEKGFMTADTRELAVLVEITASLKCKSRLRPDMSGLVGYLKEKLPPCGVERVVLGCSHYIYLAEQIAALYPDVPVCDGNADLLKEIAESVFPEKLSENSARNASDVYPSADGATGIRNTDITPTTDLTEQSAAVSPAPFTAGEKYSPASCRDEELRERVRSVKMFFTGEKEDKKYRWLLLKLLEGYAAAFRFPY